jgi:peptidoglycan-associated lipoprotein
MPANPPEAPPKAIASQVETRGPDVSRPTGIAAGSSEAIVGLNRIHFDFDQSALTAEAKATLEKNAKFLTANPGLRVRIEGHCDERGTTEYNIALGERRAKAAFQYLVDLGVDPNRMGVMSYGKEVPLDPGHNEAAWAKNRRAEFVKFQ